MKFLSKDQPERFEKEGFTALEYDFHDADMNLAHITLSGRYPDSGWTENTRAKECCYILEGSGTLTLEEATFEFEAGDALIIEPGELYYFLADAKMIIVSTPPWTPEQQKATP